MLKFPNVKNGLVSNGNSIKNIKKSATENTKKEGNTNRTSKSDKVVKGCVTAGLALALAGCAAPAKGTNANLGDRGPMGLRGDTVYTERNEENPLVPDKFISKDSYLVGVTHGTEFEYTAEYSDGKKLDCTEVATHYLANAQLCGDEGVNGITGKTGKTVEERVAEKTAAAIAAAETGKEPVENDVVADYKSQEPIGVKGDKGPMGLRGDTVYTERNEENPLVSDKFVSDDSYLVGVTHGTEFEYTAEYSNGKKSDCTEVANHYLANAQLCGDEGVNGITGRTGKTVEERVAEKTAAAIAAAETGKEPVENGVVADCESKEPIGVKGDKGPMGLRGDTVYTERNEENPLVPDKFISKDSYLVGVTHGTEFEYTAEYSDGKKLDCTEVATHYLANAQLCGDEGVNGITGKTGKTVEERVAEKTAAAIAAAEMGCEPVNRDVAEGIDGIK